MTCETDKAGESDRMEMRSFQHLAPPLRLFSGVDSLIRLGRELDRHNASRAVILCGRTLGREDSPLALVRDALGERCAGVFAGVQAHSPVPAVEAAARELERLQADAVVAVGGGSAVVTARAAGILLAEAGDARSLATSRDAAGRLHSPKLLAPKLPQFVVPTTPTTATVKAGSAVFDPVSGERLALFDPKTRAQAVFLQPDLLASAPRELITTTCLDALSGGIEGLTSRTGDPVSDALLMHAVRLLAKNLPMLARQDDGGVRGELMFAALLCGRGTDHTGGGIATVLGHAVGARHKVENGVVKAIVQPHVLAYNEGAAGAGIQKLSVALGLSESTQAAPVTEALGTMFTTLGLPCRLRDIGVARDSLADIAGHAMGDWFLRGSARPVSEAAELQNILELAW